MNSILRVLREYHDSYLVNDDGRKFFYSDVLQLIEQYSKILKSNQTFNVSNTESYKSAVLIKKSSPVHTIAIIVACFVTNSVAILMPQCLVGEELTITAEYPHNYVFKGQELRCKLNDNFFKLHYPLDVNLILFSSGTNGKIRGVMLSEQNLIVNVEAGVQHFSVAPHSNIVNVLPLYHAYGLNVATFALLYSGCNIHFANSLTYQKLIEQVEPTYFFLTPELIKTHQSLHRILGFYGSWGKNAKYVFCGGDFVDESMRKYLEENGIELFCSYGLTEAAPSVSAESFNLKKHGSVGKPIRNVKVEIINNEIVVFGPNISFGYFDDWAMGNKIRLSALHTGDLGYIDSDGFLFVTGRIKNLIVFNDGKKFTAEYLEQVVKNRLPEIQIYIHKDSAGTLCIEYYGEYDMQEIRESLSKIISPHHLTFQIIKKETPINVTFSGKIKRG